MKNTINNVGQDCTACRACENVCPSNAIMMIENEEGFLYPKIDKELCINCGACKNVCHCLKENSKKNNYKIFAVKPQNKTVSKNSASGGIAWLVSKTILEKNGIVVGAAYVDGLNVEHIIIDKVEELQRLRGSKYVISDTKDTFKIIKERLKNTEVIYIGTACQISALKAYLNKEYENLITIDIVCHGVPSLKLFKKYIEYLEKINNEKVVKYEFRNKDITDWGMGFTAKVEFENGKKKYLKADFDPYYINFLKGTIYRESCYKCKYADINKRPADMTIADFWGIEKFKPQFYDKNGVSLCIVNTTKGIKLFEKIKSQIIYESATEDEAIMFNGNLKNPTKRPEIRNSIYKGINEENFIVKKLVVKKNIKIILKNMMPRFIKKIYKRYIKNNKNGV